MKLHTMNTMDRESILIYLENLVNNGSPSGFSNQKEALGKYAAGQIEPIELQMIKIPYPVMEYSVNDGFIKSNVPQDTMIIHPLVYETLMEKERINKYKVCGKVKAYVTASGRTVLAEFQEGISFIKLHFPGVLGRVNRHLPLTKAIAGVEISNIIEQLILEGSIKGLGLLPEIKCRGIIRGDLQDSLSFVERANTPINYMGVDEKSILIPGFSLFSKDIKNTDDPVLIQQLCKEFSLINENVFFDTILKPLISGYLKLTFEYGLMPEINAQNVLYALDFDKKTIYPVLRDMGRVEKLLYVNPNLSSLISCPYKTIGKDQKEYALKRHSFSFDFKLIQYVIEPIIDSFCDMFDKEKYEVKVKLCELISQLIDSVYNARRWLPKDRKMIGHPKMLLTKERPYIEVGDPLIQ